GVEGDIQWLADASQLHTAETIRPDLGTATGHVTMITTGNGGNVILGGTGDDTISAGAGSSTVAAGTGSNVIAGDNAKATYNTAGKLIRIQSTDASAAEGGRNTITAGDGANRIIAGVGIET